MRCPAISTVNEAPCVLVDRHPGCHISAHSSDFWLDRPNPFASPPDPSTWHADVMAVRP